MIRRLRLMSGLILFAYVVTHFVDHSLGIISIAAMEAMLSVVYPLWSYPPITVLLYGALVLHMTLALYALWQRRTLSIPRSEMAQYVLGFSVPLLLAEHVTGTRIDADFYGGDFGHYRYVLSALWYGNPQKALLQMGLLLAAWIHACIGLRFWLRLRPWYHRVQPLLFAAALLLPVLALLGFVAGGRELGSRLAQDPAYVVRLLAAQPPPAARQALSAITWGIRVLFLGTILVLLAARSLRHAWWRRHGVARIVYPGGRSIEVARGFTVLEASRILGVPHAAICGGKGRCSTCRIRVRAETGALPAPSSDELAVLRRIAAPANIRLACQLRPQGAIEVTPLLPPLAPAQEVLSRLGYAQGRERAVAVLFADLRDFTRLTESKLPYDVVFLLNRYSHAMGEAIERAGGHVDKFMGDGVMALFGLKCGAAEACGQALHAARLMSVELIELNRALAADLDAPLAMGIGVHFGSAIIGDMGYAGNRSLTAVGDTVNTASRLERLCKNYDCELVLSADVALHAKLTLAEGFQREVEIQGRSRRLAILTLATARQLRLDTTTEVAAEVAARSAAGLTAPAG
ncbi:MAG TPA: adenylate/guanylate cyclase domain-containing protein [Stellaceae bacterium]|nr:adenylate/guanylate cyclase domain-containing protein [Stellaceae bacterium]